MQEDDREPMDEETRRFIRRETTIGVLMMAAWIVIPAFFTIFLWRQGCGCWALLGLIPAIWTFGRFAIWLRFKDPYR